MPQGISWQLKAHVRARKMSEGWGVGEGSWGLVMEAHKLYAARFAAIPAACGIAQPPTHFTSRSQMGFCVRGV